MEVGPCLCQNDPVSIMHLLLVGRSAKLATFALFEALDEIDRTAAF